MGTVYYLVREDNRTLYEIGKMPEWHALLGNGEPHVIADPNATAVALHAAPGWWDERPSPAYYDAVVDDIILWAGDLPFRFIDEDSGILERWSDEDPTNPYAWHSRVTGSRYKDIP